MKQVIYIIIFAVLVLGTGYLWYNNSNSTPDIGEVETGIAGARLTELRRLKTLQLDITVLKDPLFSALTNPSEALQTEVSQPAAGRVNPFLPF